MTKKLISSAIAGAAIAIAVAAGATASTSADAGRRIDWHSHVNTHVIKHQR